MVSSQDAYALYEGGRHHDALKAVERIKAQRPLSLAERVVQAQALFYLGDLNATFQLAIELFGNRDLSVRQRCRIRGTLARCYFRKGDADRAIDEFRSAIEFAERSNERWEECWLRLQFFTDQVQWLGPQSVDASLAVLRRKVHQAGDPTLAVEFQLALVQLATKLASLAVARKHLETARALLPKVANHATKTRFVFSEAALAISSGSLSHALDLGLELDRDPEYPTSRSHLSIMLGHICVQQAKFDEAERVLQRGLTQIDHGGALQLPLGGTMMALRLAEDDLDGAGEWDNSIQALLSEKKLEDSYFGLWTLVAHVKWLYRIDRIEEGLSAARKAMPRIERMADRNLKAHMQLLTAEGLGLTGDPTAGMATVAQVFTDGFDPPLEIIAESCRVKGGLISAEDPSASSSYYRRAEEILRSMGHIADAQLIRREGERRRALHSVANSNVATPAIHSVADFVERWSVLLETVSRPESTARQIFSLLIDSNSIDEGSLHEIDSSGVPRELETYQSTANSSSTRPKKIVMSFSGDTRQYEIRVAPIATARARATLLAIERIANKASKLFRSQLAQDEAELWSDPSAEQHLGLICSSEALLDLIKTIRRVAVSNVTVLLTGETGVGKELFARALHLASPRSEKVFLPFNCGTVPRDLIDSQLFGHRRGSFTGAHADAIGVIRSAAGGTLFLDEIGEMAIETQPKLLRFLEAGEILPLGETKPHTVDVRIVAATNANLDQMVADGRFREDLYYRLNVIRINIPPLRERREEIPALVEHFLDQFGRELQKPMMRIADETLEYLVLYRWPGNVRQLANELRRMAALSEPGAVLMPAHLSDDIVASRKTVPVGQAPRGFSEVVTRIDQPLSAAVEHIERAAIQRALAMTDGNLVEAARMLGLSRKGLYLKRHRLKLD